MLKSSSSRNSFMFNFCFLIGSLEKLVIQVKITLLSELYFKSIIHNCIQEDKYPDKNECSYDGIQDCVQFAVYEEWTTVETIICAVTGGFDCIAIEAAACIEKNCF